MNETKASAFIQRLASLADDKRKDRAALAMLRRSLAFEPGSHVPSFPVVEPWLDREEGWQREVYYLVAGLFALDPRQGPLSFAEAMAALYRRRQSGSIEARFLALLDADRDQLPDRLRRCVYLIRTEEGPGLDWAALLSDLLGWFHPDHPVQRRWARMFYRSIQEGDETQSKEGDQP